MLGLHAFHVGMKIARRDEPFYALIAAAMLKADTDNARRLRSVFPEVWTELQSRYGAPLGVIESDGDIDFQRLRLTLVDL